MDTLQITIQLDNDAFADNPTAEVCRILTELVRGIQRDHRLPNRFLLDANGNTCGTASTSVGGN